MCFGCSKEPSHRDGSFEYPKHMFWLRNKNNNFQIRTLIWRPDCMNSFILLNTEYGNGDHLHILLLKVEQDGTLEISGLNFDENCRFHI